MTGPALDETDMTSEPDAAGDGSGRTSPAGDDSEGEAGTARRPMSSLLQRIGSVERRWQVLVVGLLVVAVGAGLWWSVLRDPLPEGAAFRLGDTVVSADDVNRRIDALEALYGVSAPEGDDDTFLRDAAKSMAVQLMLKDEASDLGVVIAEKDLDITLQALIEQRYPDGSRDAFVATLGELGATEAQVRDEIRDQLLVSKLFTEVTGDVDVSEDELKAAFEDRKGQLGTPVRRELSNIVVADEKSARQVLRRLRSGEGFAKVARAQSLDEATRDAGGKLGAVAEGDLDPAYGEAAFSAPVGKLFGPVQSEFGWNVGRVEKVLRAMPANYADLRVALRETVLAERAVDTWRAWLKDVLESHEVTYADGYRPADPDAVPDIDQAAPTGGG